jgi:hypothetical protein
LKKSAAKPVALAPTRLCEPANTMTEIEDRQKELERQLAEVKKQKEITRLAEMPLHARIKEEVAKVVNH